VDFSIILCTYNPDPDILFRSLKAIFSLQVPENKNVEFILVDNNSSQSVNKLISEWQPRFDPSFGITVVEEKKPGLLFARKRGFETSTGEIIVFFDDDNEPAKDYLLGVQALYHSFPNIGVAGPANITVEFVGNVEPWLIYYKGYFQERSNQELQFACYHDWLGFYPPGTGQTVRRPIYIEYLNRVESGMYSSVGRTESAMTSAEDVQLVFCAILMEYAAASGPALRLNHLIASKKTSIPYLKRLLFGMASSYPEAYAECYPHTRNVLPFYSNSKIFMELWAAFVQKIIRKKSPKSYLFYVSELLGRMYGSNQARGRNAKSFWFNLIPMFKLR